MRARNKVVRAYNKEQLEILNDRCKTEAIRQNRFLTLAEVFAIREKEKEVDRPVFSRKVRFRVDLGLRIGGFFGYKKAEKNLKILGMTLGRKPTVREILESHIIN